MNKQKAYTLVFGRSQEEIDETLRNLNDLGQRTELRLAEHAWSNNDAIFVSTPIFFDSEEAKKAVKTLESSDFGKNWRIRIIPIVVSW